MTPTPAKMTYVGLVALLLLSSFSACEAQQYIKINNAAYPDRVLPSPLNYNGPLSGIMPVACPAGGVLRSPAVIATPAIAAPVCVGAPYAGSVGAAVPIVPFRIVRHPADVSPWGLWHPNNWFARIFDYMSGP